jgi:FKBP12-rapamycin complex-associated protein
MLTHLLFYWHVGKLAQQGGTFTTDFVEFELERAIEWLTGNSAPSCQHKCTAACQYWPGFLTSGHPTALPLIAADRQEARRHASVLVLAELVRHADVIVYPYVGSILDHIWVAFRDPNVSAIYA